MYVWIVFGSCCYCMTTVPHLDCGMQIIAQVRRFLFVFSYVKHYLILHVFFHMSFSRSVYAYLVVCLSVHHLFLMVLMLMTRMIMLEESLNDQL